MKQQQYTLSNTGFLYPSFPLQGGYDKFDTYNSESIRLLKYIKQLSQSSNKNTVFNLMCGSPLEELHNTNTNIKFKNSSYQSIPIWLRTLPGDYPTRICIISPNNTFSPQLNKEPKFITKTNKLYKWDKKDYGHYVSKTHDIHVNIFCTLFPHNDQKRNKLIINKLLKTDISQFYPSVKKARQTAPDIDFINQFYKSLNTLFDTIEDTGGVIIGNNYAVFRYGSSLSKYADYTMCLELKKQFPITKYKTRYLGEWIFKQNNHTLVSYNNRSITVNYSFDPGDNAHDLVIGLNKKNNHLFIKLIKFSY